MSDNDEHRELVAVWKSLNGVMDGLRQRLRWGDTEYMDVTDMADRVRGLSILLDSAVEAAKTATSYFWLLGAHPHAYDTWKAHNEASLRTLQAGGAPELPPEPGAEDVPYPADPLRRLVAMHSSANEILTDLAFVSPWPREDARFGR
jgi:hypothetical protein